jgi:thiol-disulfide isomerase/thioredoxin
LLIAIPLGILAIAGSFFTRSVLPSDEQLGSPTDVTPAKGEPRVGSLAPDFTLQRVGTSENLSLSSLRGKPVWVNFWATWCPPCREEMPEMERLYRQHRALGLEIVGVDVEESEEAISTFTGQLGLTFTFVRDADGKTTDLYYVSGLPSHYFIDRKGIIQAIHVGGLSDEMHGPAPVDDYLQLILKP